MSRPGNSMRPVTLDYESVPSVPTSYVNVPGWGWSGTLTQETQPRATGTGAIAIGRDADAVGTDSIAIGPNTDALGTRAIALGRGCRAIGTDAIAMGSGSYAETGAAIGYACHSTGSGVAMGSGVGASGLTKDAINGIFSSAHVGISTDDDDTICRNGVGIGIDVVARPGIAVGKRVTVGGEDTNIGIGHDLKVFGTAACSIGKDFNNNVEEDYFFMAGITTPMVGTGLTTGFMRNHVMYHGIIALAVAGPTALTAFQFDGQNILLNDSGVACTATAPTATVMRNRFASAQVGDSFDVWMINPTAAVTFTLTLGAGSGYNVASYILAAQSSVCLRFRFTDVTIGASTLSLDNFPFPPRQY